MVHFLLFPLLLGSVREATALVLSSQQRLQPTTTLALDRRQATVTKFSTVFSTGDRSKIRTADSGFEFRVDVLNGLWGVCATSDADVKDCGMAGSCVDSFSCSKGCGFTGEALPTFTWYVPNVTTCWTEGVPSNTSLYVVLIPKLRSVRLLCWPLPLIHSAPSPTSPAVPALERTSTRRSRPNRPRARV